MIQGADGDLYGTTYDGGSDRSGTLFRIGAAGQFTPLRSLSRVEDGQYLSAGLTAGADGLLHGAAYQGGANDWGTLFHISPAGGFQVTHHFDRTNGGAPHSNLTFGADGLLYFTTQWGGEHDDGTLFRIHPDDSGYEVLFSFDRNGQVGAMPCTPLMLGSDGHLYGNIGGTFAIGSIFVLDDTGVPVVVQKLPAYWEAYGELLEFDPSTLIGTFNEGGALGSVGSVYSLRTG